MPVPTAQDYAISEIDDLHHAVLVKLRVWQRAGPNRDATSIRSALQDYADKVVDFINGGES